MMVTMSHRIVSVLSALVVIGACAGPTVSVGPVEAPGSGGQVSVSFTERSPTSEGGGRPDAGGFPLPECPGTEDAGVALAPLCRGTPAPFTGVLVSPAAASTIIAQLEGCKAECDEAARHAKQQCEDTCAYELKVLKAQLRAEQSKREAQVLSRDKQIDVLSEQLASERDQPVWLWVGGGALGGVLLTAGAVLLLK